VVEDLKPIAALYENVKGATERMKGKDGTIHRPAVEASRLICMFIYIYI